MPVSYTHLKSYHDVMSLLKAQEVKIVILQSASVGKDVDLSKFQTLGNVVMYEDTKDVYKRQIPYLASLLEKHQKELLDIDEMIITCGPGSYTGERVAMTIAKTLSVISPVKIKVISSLAAYAGKQKCVSVIDARSQKIFVCAYECGKPLIHEQLLPCLLYTSLYLKKKI